MSPRHAAWVACALLAACDPATPALSDAHTAAMRDSVATALAALQRYGAAGQWDSLLSLYANDPGFLMIEDGAVGYRSVAEIRDGLAQLPADWRIDARYDGLEITPVAPGVASAAMGFTTSFVDSTGTAAFTFNGAVSLLWVHRPDGWKILSGHSSTARPDAPQ